MQIIRIVFLLSARCIQQQALSRLAGVMFLVMSSAAIASSPYPAVQVLGDDVAAFIASSGTVEAVESDDEIVYRWRPVPGQAATLSLRSDHPVFGRLRYYEQLTFDFRIASGAVNQLDLNVLGHVSGPRQNQIHNFVVAVRSTAANVWHPKQIDLARPFWFPWTEEDGSAQQQFLRFETLAIEPDTVIEIRQPTLVNTPLYVKPDYETPITWPRMTLLDDGGAQYEIVWQVVNTSGLPAEVRAVVVSEHERFDVKLDTPVQAAKNNEKVTFKVTATITGEQVSDAPVLYSEPLRLAISSDIAPEARSFVTSRLVRPLPEETRRQVLIDPTTLAEMRKAVADKESPFAKQLKLTQLIAAADTFVETELLALPREHTHVKNGYPSRWRPTTRMPEIEDPSTGEKQFGTFTANKTWKEHLGYAGKVPSQLGLAWLLTEDERYAEKGIELLEFLGARYTGLNWYVMFDVPWYHGSPIQTSSRIASNSSYGSNWHFKWLCEMASAIADAPGWTDARRDAVYNGFVLPYATELTKMNPPISNMSDISMRNLLLLGLAFNDPLMVWYGTQSDHSALNRLADIDDDGFTSESRPLNYHYAGMKEYLDSMVYLENANLGVDYPKQRLLEAVRMPYQRATLWGTVPNSGDVGRGSSVDRDPIAGKLIPLFPTEAWLGEIGRPLDPESMWFVAKNDILFSRKAWNERLASEPTLFRDAGLGILRTGKTPEEQVMVTLDYGRNVFHAHRDRQQVTLSAFGKTFTHGPGSLYNVGKGGITRVPDPDLDAFISKASLAQNVVVVDASDQSMAIGELLAWSIQGEMQSIVSRVDGVYPGVSHTRGVALSHGIIVMFDRMESEAEHTYDFVYHNFGQATPADGWKAQPRNEPLAATGQYQHLKELRTLQGDGPLRVHWDLTDEHSGKKPDGEVETIGLNFWQPPMTSAEAFLAVTGLNNPNTKTVPGEAPSVIRRVTGRSAEFVTVLEPYRGRSKIESIETVGDQGVRITLTDGTRIETSLAALIKRQ